MTTKYEMLVEVESDQRDKRRRLVTGIDVALCASGARIGAGSYEVTIRRLPQKEVLKQIEDAKRCHADDDDHCTWSECPQLRDGEPKRSGRHCPLDARDDDDT